MYFPSWRYHRTEKPRIVRNPDEDEALGEGWADTPAAFLEESAPEAPAAGDTEPDTPSEGGEAPAARGKRRKKAE